MSREFHWIDGGYLHTVLASVGGDRPVTGEPVADAIRALLILLAPLEYAVATEQACDSGHDVVVIACHEHRSTMLQALEKLRREIVKNDELVNAIIRKAIGRVS